MIKITAIFDNKIASPMSPEEFAKTYLINCHPSVADLLHLEVRQGDWPWAEKMTKKEFAMLKRNHEKNQDNN